MTPDRPAELKLADNWLADVIHDARIDMGFWSPGMTSHMTVRPYTTDETEALRHAYRRRFKEKTGQDL